MNESMVPRDTFLEPSRVLVNMEPALITTVVGSAVAVTIWDNARHFGGMCHYIYPEIHEKEKTTVEYGNVAIYVLLKTMHEFGSKMRDLEAQIFGGAEPSDSDGRRTNGYENVQSAFRSLQKYRINIVADDTGGHVGRKIAFNTHKNEVVTYKVKRMRKEDWHFV